MHDHGALFQLNYADARPAFKKDDKTDKGLFMSTCTHFLIKSFRNYNVVFVKVLTQNNV